jgi:hypothetical protein
MADVTPQQLPAPDALAQYRSLLDQRIDGHSQLVPLDVLPALEREIEATLQPAHSREVSMAIAALGAWLKIPQTIEDPEQFGKAMEEDLAARGYPADILNEAVLQARRTLDWYPSIREMLALCDRLVEPRRRQFRAIWQMEAEHRRRQQEVAEREAQAEQEGQRAAERIRWLQALEGQSRERFGNAAPLPGDIELADSISISRYTPWLSALKHGEPWAAKFCRLMALAERTRRAITQGRIAWNECLAIGKLISRDEAAARSQVEKAEARAARPQYEFPPPESFWDALSRIRKVCGLDVPRSGDPDVIATAVENAKHLSALAGLADVRAILDRQVLEEWERRPGRLVSPGPPEPGKEQQ